MKQVNNFNDLENRIEELESLREVQKEELKENFRAVAHELSPVNILRKGMHEIVQAPGMKATAIDTAIGSGLGFIGKKLFVRGSGNIFRKFAGSALEFVIANVVRNKIPAIRNKKREMQQQDPNTEPVAIP
jgi:hypothetical protein